MSEKHEHKPSCDPAVDRFSFLSYRLIVIFTSVGTLYAFIFGIMDLVRGYPVMGVSEEIFGLTTFLTLVYLKKTRNINMASNIILVLMLVVFFIMIFYGKDDDTGAYWYFTFPPLALFLKGARRGLRWCAVLFILTVGLGVAAHYGLIVGTIMKTFNFIMLFFTIAAVTVLVYFYEYLHQQYQRDWEAHQIERFENRTLIEQFSYAGKLQLALLPPSALKFSPLEAISFYRATMGVGGDYIDYQRASRDRMIFVVGDVSGKGVSASLVMVNMRSVFQNAITNGVSSPAVILQLFNSRMLQETAHDMYFSASVFMYDRSISRVTYCNAGIGPFLVYKTAHKRIIEYPSQYVPCGVQENIGEYENGIVDVEPGDAILAFTDGLEEAWEGRNSENGRAAVMSRFEQGIDMPLEGLKEHLLPDFTKTQASGRRFDDIALVIGRITG